MALSAGVAYVDVLPNMSKFGPALSAQSGAAGGALKGLAATGALALGAVAAASVKLAVDFESSMRNVNSIAQLPEPAFERLQQDVLDLAGPTAQAPKTLADGLYDLVSSGFSASDSLKILKSSAIAATAGLTTTDVATKAVSAVLNAYKLPATEAKRVSDELFKTVDQGVITFEDLASNIGDTLPFAASLGVGLDEVGAATATLTKQGLGASETFTRIRNLLQTMIKPGEDLQAAFNELGVESGEALINQKGLQGALEALIGTTDGSKAAVAKLFPNIRALGGALALTGDNAKGAREDLRSLGEAEGATQKAFAEQQKSVAVQLQRLSANLQVLGIRIGQALLPPINDFLHVLNDDVGPAFQKIAAVVGPILSVISDTFGGFGRLIIAGLLGPVGIAIGLFTRFRGAITDAFNAVKAAGAAAFGWLRGAAGTLAGFLAGIWRGVSAAARAAFGAIRAVATTAFNVIKAVTAPVRAYLLGVFQTWRAIGTAVFHALSAVARVAWSAIKAAFVPVRAVISAGFSAIRAVGTAVFGALKSAGSTAFNALKSVMNAFKSAGTAAFNAVKSVISGMIGVIQDAIGVVNDLLGAVGDALDAIGDVANAVSSLPGKVAGLIPGVASGGPVGKGNAYLVGERGPELFVPPVSGKIVPNHRLKGVAPGGRSAFVITNWREGVGFFQDVSDGSVASAASLQRQRARMRT